MHSTALGVITSQSVWSGFNQLNAVSNRFTSIHWVSLRFTQMHLVPFRILLICSLASRFTKTLSDSFRFALSTPAIAHSFSDSPKTYSDSPNLRQIHLISFRSTQSRLGPLRFASSHSGSLSLTPIYSVSLRFTELHLLSDWDHIQILSDSFILAQIHSDLLRLSQMCSIWFSCTLDSDQFRFF